MTGPNAEQLAGAVLTIDVDAVVHNWRTLRDRLTTDSECGAVLKADAYGLGAEQLAPALWDAGCRVFFVALPHEGIKLRELLPRGARVVILDGLFPGAEADYVQHRLVPTLNHPGDIDAWRAEAHRVGRPLPAALHIDTGMNRLGLSPKDCAALLDGMDALDGIDVQALMTHLAAADVPSHPLTARQLTSFRQWEGRFAAAGLRTWTSVANSAGILLHPQTHADLARPGIALFGCAPDPARSKEQTHGLRPVVSLRARVLQVRSVDTPQTVGYGAAYRVTGPSRIATVAVGYADGYLRSVGGADGAGSAGFLNGHRVTQAGRISMDLATFDVSHVPEELAAPGEWLELIGPGRDVDAVAQDAGTIGYEVLTRLGGRFQRVYHGGVAAASELDADLVAEVLTDPAEASA